MTLCYFENHAEMKEFFLKITLKLLTFLRKTEEELYILMKHLKTSVEISLF